MKNYTKITSKFIEDIQSNVTIYQHNKTHARVCTIENDDNNKVFSIAFRTPPINNGGLTHILEHSVLCGSKNYPVKDPFVELMKSSLNTFLNAFTFPDKTMYPCASQNDKDFKNLMSVYMDAVFYPQIYSHEEIFMQEGWHYHILDENDPITYNGVVYNEMKGAFSDPQQILFRNLMHSLYPDTAYGYESGGNPDYIPDLTYDEFIDFHSKFYHPSNSYIFVYGNCDMEERLNWLDEAYLKDFDKKEFDTTIKPQKPFSTPKYETSYYPVAKEVPLEGKAFLSYNVALPLTLDTKRMIATEILVDVLFNNPGAPVKQALIDAKLGADVIAAFDDGLLQPLLGIIVVSSDEAKEKTFIELVDKAFNDVLKNGLDHEALKSLINYKEFKVREGKHNMPAGLIAEMTSLSSWLYSEDQPFAKLESLKYFKELKDDLNTGYFESIIKDDFLNNTHKSYVKLLPSYTCAEEAEAKLVKKLADYKASLSKEELAALIKKNKDLQIYQSTPSTEEEINTLPKLGIDDLTTTPEKLNLEVKNEEFKVLFSEYFTNDINYVSYNFDMSDADIKTYCYAQLLSDLFKNLSTKSKSFGQINQVIQKYTGGLNFSVDPVRTVDGKSKCFFKVSYSTLGENVSVVNNLVEEIINETDFEDVKRLYERVNELYSTAEMGIVSKGHIVSLYRAASYISKVFAICDVTQGLGYVDFISDIMKSFETNKEQIIADVKAVITNTITKKNFMLSFTGSKENLESFMPTAKAFYNSLSDNDYRYSYEFNEDIKNEGIKAQFDVNFVARMGKYKEEYNGAMNVLKNALDLDYLWQQVRVHGGAYGCFLFTTLDKMIGFASYRDPEVQRTNKVYEDIVDFIENLDVSDENLLKYKIGAIGALDNVLHVSDKGNSAKNSYLSGYSYELQCEHRMQTINATAEDLKALASLFKEALSDNVICVLGNAKKIEESASLFKTVRNLSK